MTHRVWTTGSTFRAELFRRQDCRWCERCSGFHCLDIGHDTEEQFPDLLQRLALKPNNCPFPSCGKLLEKASHQSHLCSEFPPRGLQQLRSRSIAPEGLNRSEKRSAASCSGGGDVKVYRQATGFVPFCVVYINRTSKHSAIESLVPKKPACCAASCMRLFCIPEFHGKRKVSVPGGDAMLLAAFVDQYPNWCIYCLMEMPYASDRLVHHCIQMPTIYARPTPYQKETALAYRNGLERRDRAHDVQKRRLDAQTLLIAHIRDQISFCKCINCERVHNAKKNPDVTSVLFLHDEYDDIGATLAELDTQQEQVVVRNERKRKLSGDNGDWSQKPLGWTANNSGPAANVKPRKRPMMRKRLVPLVMIKADLSKNMLLTNRAHLYSTYQE